jgi:hypothetical protein
VFGVKREIDMAQGWISVCTNCGYALEGWDEGNPWTKDGVVRIQMPGAETLPPIRKEYIYHPSPRNVRIMGNDVRHLCVDCGRKFYCDVIALEAEGLERPACIKCGGPNAIPFDELRGHPCPKCRKGHFEIDEGSVMIS